MTFKFSERSIVGLIGVHPDLREVAERALELSNVDFGISEGLRTVQRQLELMKAGKSQTMKSRHLTGHAIDVFAVVNGAVSWNWMHYQQIASAFKKAAEELGVKIVWGGDWRTLKDGPHIELDRKFYPA